MFNRHRLFYLRLLIPYALGVFAGLYLIQTKTHVLFLLIPGILGCLIYAFLPSKTKIRGDMLYGFALMILVFGIGALRQHSFNEINRPNHFSALEQSPDYYYAKIAEEPLEKENFVRCRIQLQQAHFSNNSTVSVSGSVLAYFKKPVNHSLRIGDYITLSNQNIIPVEPPKNPGEFNYKRFLSYKNIYFQCFLNPDAWKHTGKYSFGIMRLASDSRKKVLGILSDIFNDKEKLAFAEALLVGYKNNLSLEVVDAFSKTGTLHVLAVSGLHAGIIYLILNFLLTPIARRGRLGVASKVLIVIMGMWFYAFITGLSPSVFRAALMLSIIQIAPLFNRRTQIFSSIFASAFIILLIDPLLLVSVGFQLSYAAVLGIVYFQPKIKYWYAPNNKVSAFFWNLTAVSLAAQLATFTIGISYFYQFPTYFLLSNLIIIPAVLITMSALIATVTLSFIPFLGSILSFATSMLIGIVLYCVKTIETFPKASIDKLFINPLELVLLYGCILFLSWWLVHKRKTFFHLGTMSMIVLLGSIGLRIYHQNRQQFVAIHYIHKHQVVSVVSGRSVYIVANPLFLDDENTRRFYLRPFVSENGLRHVHYMAWDSSHASNSMTLQRQTLVFGNGAIAYRKNALQVFDGRKSQIFWLYQNPKHLGHAPKQAKAVLQKSWIKL
jgi:competence protein ComEC